MSFKNKIKSINLQNSDVVIVTMSIPENNTLYQLGIGTAIDNQLARNIISDDYADAVNNNNYQLGKKDMPELGYQRQFVAVRKLVNDKIIAIDPLDPLFNDYKPVKDEIDVSVSFKDIDWNKCDLEDRAFFIDMYNDYISKQTIKSNSYYVKEFVAVDEEETGKLIPIDPESDFFTDYDDVKFIPNAKINYKPIKYSNISIRDAAYIQELYLKYSHNKNDEKKQKKVFVKKR